MSKKQSTKIGISANAFAHGGGSERYARDVAKQLIASGIDLTVYARKIDESLPELHNAKHELIDTSFVPRFWRQKIYDFKLGRRISQAGSNRIFAINHTIHADVSACVGTHIGHLNASKKKTGLHDKQVIAYEKAAYKNSRIIVAHSKLMQRELEEFYDIPREKIKLLYPPCDSNKFVAANAQQRLGLRRRFGFPDEKVVFLFVSTGHARKGYELLASVFSQTNLPILLVVAGRSIPKPTHNILEIGYRSDIEAAYQAADYTILASSYEPFGLACVESILCGTPVIIGKNIGSAEIIKGPSNIFFDPKDETNLKKSIEEAYLLYINGTSRIKNITDSLDYNTSIGAHVDELLKFLE
jgi:glycosyltransferase involved in cell wall biosynthesis